MPQLSVRDLRKHERIKFELRLAGSSLADVSRRLGVSQGAVSMVSVGRKRSKKIEAAIAAELGKRPEILWPKRYPVGRAAMT
jgi:lambda repressor-like predicted transcriptional regulator